MTELEERLRSAFRAKAGEIPASPPPLELEPQPAHDAARDGRGGKSRLTASRRWLIPASAAAAVLAVTAGALAVAGLLPGQRTAPAAEIQTNVPPYYVALMESKGVVPSELDSAPANIATVRATSTGAVLASVRAPRPYAFMAVTAATDDRSFVLFAVGPSTQAAKFPGMFQGKNYAQHFFFLRVHPNAPNPSARAQLTPLPQVYIGSGLTVEAMALSPDGQSLAVIMSDPDRTIGTVTPAQLTIFNLDTGAEQTWTRNVCYYRKCAPGPIGDWATVREVPSALQLSWTSDGRSLLFITGDTGTQVRLLNISSPGGSLMADSYALPVSTTVRYWTDAVITPDGKSVFIDYTYGAGATGVTLLRFSASTGRARVLSNVLTYVGGRPTGYGPDLLAWTNDNGSKVIVVGAQRGTPANHATDPIAEQFYAAAGIYAGGRYTPIPWPHGVFDAAW